MYHIEMILKSRAHGGKIKLLVLWLGYNSDFGSWISVEDVQNA